MLMKFATRQFSTSNLQCWRIAVIGSGLMGSGIAQVSAQSEHFVAIVDQSKPILDKAQKAIEANIVRVARKKFESDNEKQATFVKNVLKNITLTTDVNNAVSEADLVIEAVAEKLQLKQELLAQIEQAVPRKTIIATNTSSLRLQDISKNLKRKENFGGLHFFNPVPVMKLLEVVRGESTSDDTFNYLLKYGESIGKVTVKCKDTPGFIVNRLLVPYMLEAMRLYERGDASKEDIDQAMKLGAGYPMGPFQLLDYVGLDTTKFIQDGWHSSYPSEENFRPVEVLDKLVKEGKFGMKTGEGFYKYESKK